MMRPKPLSAGSAEDAVEAHVQRVAVHGEVDRAVVAVENEAMHVARGLVLGKQRREAGQRAVTLGQRVFSLASDSMAKGEKPKPASSPSA